MQNWIDGVPPLPAQGGNKWDGYRATAAIAAMQCVLSNERIMTEAALHCEEKSIPEQVAETAVSMADALIAELQRTEK